MWEAERGNRAGWTWPRAVQTNPSPVAWLPLNLGNRTTVGKQDCFKDTWWRFQFSFVTQNMWSPWILFDRLDQGTQSPVFSSLAPVMRQCWVISLVVWVCSGEKSASCHSPDMLEGSKNRHGKAMAMATVLALHKCWLSHSSGSTTATSQCASSSGMKLVPFICHLGFFSIYIYIFF